MARAHSFTPEFTFYDSLFSIHILIESFFGFLIGGSCSSTDLPEKIDYSRTSFSLRSASTLDITSAIFVWSHLFLSHMRSVRFRSCYKTESLCFKSLWPLGTFPLWFAISCISAPRYIRYNFRVRLLVRVFSVLSNEGLSQSGYQNQIEGTFGVAFWKFSTVLWTGWFSELIIPWPTEPPTITSI